MKRKLFWCCCLLLMAASPLAAMPLSKLSVELQSQLSAASPGTAVPVIVTLADQVDVEALAIASGPTTRMSKGERQAYRSTLLNRLKQTATDSQAGLVKLLRQQGVDRVKQIWHVNSLALNATPELLALLEARPEVAIIDFDRPVHKAAVTPLVDSNHNAVEDNLDLIKVSQLWTKGLAGAGMTVAIIDSGVDLDHPDLVDRWRGGSNSWFNAVAANCGDPAIDCATSCDVNTVTPCDYLDPAEIAHGTGVAGLMVGDNAGGTAIGVAPGAQWIAAKIFDHQDGTSTSVLFDALDWVLDPDGNPVSDDAPDVVNASWGYDPGECVPLLLSSVRALRAAGIAFVSSAGNEGPASNTSVSPANYPESLAVGSVGTHLSTTEISDFSGRGPSACTDKEVYPDVVAPGFAVKTADLTSAGTASYVSLSGTSFSSRETAEIITLLRGVSGFPGATLDVLYQALTDSAIDLGSNGPDTSYGYGLVDADTAYQLLLPPMAVPAVPVNGTTGLEGDVTLGWVLGADHFGASVAVEVLLDTDPAFGAAMVVSLLNQDEQGTVLLGLVGAGLLLVPLAGQRRRRRWSVVLLLLMVAGLYSCGGGGGGDAQPPPEPSATRIATGLSPGTTYYWKVVTQTDRGGPASESAVFHFTTAP